ncbi:hypothetical protein K8O96_11890 [Clostridium sporogenes]|uniref:Uncharacterized protein n=1 Tax=Clostridium botulinum TaxID=1491 RepID=A0A6M0SW57_CLOBO|nr:hypothetical protein [Clostridium sporogenes]NFA59504.1 hypothetical protein [Clostridium botulinum]NFI74688.1 hypothetical protein [Clostridium sporogenes]NFL71177.1 hypothetical protein [Clostridium sporogenes]NFM24989.1 hypothetical protein [Clostridium sporogenes]NFP62450.1 hypothetical protein [Clostridium sporogenes]
MKKYRVKREFIYDNTKLEYTDLYQQACNLGYTFVKDGNDYRMITINEYKTKPSLLQVDLVNLEIIEEEK